MIPITETYIDKSEWPEGQWDIEPDKVEWRYEKEPHFPCLIVRSPNTGALCGYVGVSKDHPAYEKSYYDVDFKVHGGLTYARKCQEGGKICHTPLQNESDDIWWLGFDCAHSGDVCPTLERIWKRGEEIYKNIDYVTRHVNKLAEQLAAMKN